MSDPKTPGEGAPEPAPKPETPPGKPKRKRGPLAKVLAKVANDEVLDRLLRGGAMALVIKVGAAGLSFLMFMLLARASTIDEFGRFGFAFSLAGMLSVVGSFGQRMMVMRQAPAYAADGDDRRLTGIIRYGYAWVLGGCTLMGLGLALGAQVWPGLEHRGYLVAGGVMTVMIGLAEYQSRAMRSVTGMALALAPRDVFWRLGVSALAGAWILAGAPPMTAPEALYLSSALLLAVLVVQAMLHPITRPHALFRARAAYERTEWRRISMGLWGVSVMQIAGPNFSIVLVGFVLAAEPTAQLFAALRVAMLLELFTLAAQMVSAAQISARWHKGDVAGVQRICRVVTLGAALPALAAFLFFALFGRWVMGLFGSEFAGGQLLLVILSCGFLAKTVFGQSALLMQLAGRERAFMRIVTICNLASVAAILAATLLFGVVGAAVATTAGLISWTAWAQWDVRRSLGVDPSLLGALRSLKRNRDRARTQEETDE